MLCVAESLRLNAAINCPLYTSPSIPLSASGFTVRKALLHLWCGDFMFEPKVLRD
jgi:hypothetical protein